MKLFIIFPLFLQLAAVSEVQNGEMMKKKKKNQSGKQGVSSAVDAPLRDHEESSGKLVNHLE